MKPTREELIEALQIAVTLFPHYPAGTSLAKKVEHVKTVLQQALKATA